MLFGKKHPGLKIDLMSGYDAPVAFLLIAGLVERASNPTYREFHGNQSHPFVRSRHDDSAE